MGVGAGASRARRGEVQSDGLGSVYRDHDLQEGSISAPSQLQQPIPRKDSLNRPPAQFMGPTQILIVQVDFNLIGLHFKVQHAFAGLLPVAW